MQIDTSRGWKRTVAVLGPTNTGKTHLAMERMLGHSSGMIGFPLRLLARENYDRAVKAKGRTRVALITGEEKIVPKGAHYFLCTVEAMPLAREVSFLAVDEIQMCADPDRGHVFTQRLLHARGSAETMFLGAETIRPLIRRLVPEIEFISRPRFSTLTYTGHRKITRLPSRSAVVAFSAADVYSIAEMIRRHRGGAAVVLGALSPRTRNAQVGMYQAGEVDYLVATDAIGMGLNMDVDHVAFAATRKFDGQVLRDLTPAEMAQIGGRAGRHMNDGTFGVTADAPDLDTPLVKSMEAHSFEPLKTVYWRNPALHFHSIEALKASLTVAPETKGLVRARADDDERALALLSGDAHIAGLATTADAVRLLWEVCRIPDFSKMSSEAHSGLLARIYRTLMGPDGCLPTDWIAGRVAQIDRVDGDIHTLAGRIAQIRTWTTIAFHGDWLADAAHWQARTREVEDRLSDALHEGLTQRFVDKRTAVLMRQMKEQRGLLAVVNAAGDVLVEGQPVGRLDGFHFTTDLDQGPAMGHGAGKAVTAAAERALRQEITARVRRLAADGDDAFELGRELSSELSPEAGPELSPEGESWNRVVWRGAPVARLTPGTHVLSPVVAPLGGGLLESDGREAVGRRLTAWMEKTIGNRLAPLLRLRDAPLKGAARGLAFQLTEALGSLPRRSAADQVGALSRTDRRDLRALGVCFGRESIYLPALLKPGAMAMRGVVWAVAMGREDRGKMSLPEAGRVSIKPECDLERTFLEAVGFCTLGPLSVRTDIAERVAGRAWSLARKSPFTVPQDLLSLAGCSADDMTHILKALGYRAQTTDSGVTFTPKRQRRTHTGPKTLRPARRPDGESPFAKLRDLASP